MKHVAVGTSIAMIAVAGVVVSQTGFISLQGQLSLNENDMMNSSEDLALPNDSSTSPSHETAEMPPPPNTTTENPSPQDETVEIVDCDGIRDAKKALCENAFVYGTMTCSDIAKDCMDACTYPWPVRGICESSCRTEEKACLSEVTMANITCVSENELSHSECKDHNKSIQDGNIDMKNTSTAPKE